MNESSLKMRVVWKNFAKLMAVVFAFILLTVYLIYDSALLVIQNQFCQLNLSNAEQLREHLASEIRQADRMAAVLCVDTEAQMFFWSANPEASDAGLYRRLKTKLKSYAYGIEAIFSVLLYAPTYGRMLDDSATTAYQVSEITPADVRDADWIDALTPLDAERVRTTFKIRAIRSSYPYVLTLIKQYRTLAGEGVVAVNLDLKRLYDALWVKDDADTTVWVLDEAGRVVIRRNKLRLWESRAEESDLRAFSLCAEPVSRLLTDGETPQTYAQQFSEEYGLYFVSVTTLRDYQTRIGAARRNALLIGLICVFAAAGLILLYSVYAFRPLKSILSLLEDPARWTAHRENSESEIREISERIISNLQLSERLRAELDKHVSILRETQMQALQAQLNPHFLFNTLDVIGMMIEEREGADAAAARLVSHLADILRYSLSGGELTTLAEELDYTRKYVYILECRYRGSFRAEFDFEPALRAALVPKMLLQPLIENAVFHGIAARDAERGGLLTVLGRVEALDAPPEGRSPRIRIEILDNGGGMTEAELERVRAAIADEERVASRHIGVQNVSKRLSLLFPHESEVLISSAPGAGTRVTLRFPQVTATPPEGAIAPARDSANTNHRSQVSGHG